MNSLDSETFFDHLTDIVPVDQNSLISVAFSGGIDSTVLLHLLKRAQGENRFKLKALHVDHAIDQQSKMWHDHCKDFCRSIDVPYQHTRLAWPDNKKQYGEHEMREARFDWLRKKVSRGDLLMTAHHLNDQAETLLQNLMRGSGARGLSAIQEVTPFGNGHLVRPMLNFSKEQICKYAAEHNLSFIEDPANLDLTYDRNYIRHVIIPSLAKRWPAAATQIARSASYLTDARSMLEQLGKIDMEACASKGGGFFAIGCQLSVERIRDLERSRQINLIRYWTRSFDLGEPGRNSLDNLVDSVIRDGARYYELSGLNGYRICCYGDNLYLTSDNNIDTSEIKIPWDLKQALYVPQLELNLVPTTTSGDGIAIGTDDEIFTVKFRVGGERILLPGAEHSSCLKKLFQHHRIPPWERNRLPLIYRGDVLVAVIPWLYALRSNAGTAKRTVKVSADYLF